MRALAVRPGRAVVELVEELSPPVEQEDVARPDEGVEARSPDVLAAGSLDPQDGDALGTQVELAQRPAGEPVAFPDADLADAPAASEVEQLRVVLCLEVGVAPNEPREDRGEQSVEPPRPRDQEEERERREEDTEPAERLAARRVREADDERGDRRDDPAPPRSISAMTIRRRTGWPTTASDSLVVKPVPESAERAGSAPPPATSP